jgi:hypothetical protein
MTEVGIDTSFLIGLLDPKDIWHEATTASLTGFARST